MADPELSPATDRVTVLGMFQFVVLKVIEVGEAVTRLESELATATVTDPVGAVFKRNV